MRAVLLAVLMAGMAWGAAPPARLTAENATLLRERNSSWDAGSKDWKAGRQEQAIAALEKVLKIELAVMGPWHRDTQSTANRLGDWYQERGEWDKEAACRRMVAEARRRLDGKGHHRTVDARLELEEALAQPERTPKQREALARARRLAPKAHASFRKGEYKAALLLFKLTLKMNEEVLGKRHPDYAASLNNLAMLLKETGDHKAALPLYREALKVNGEVLGKLHPSYATSLNNLAALLKDMGDHKGALPLFREALKVNGEILGKRHPDYATSLNNLAKLLHEMVDFKGALPLFREALKVNGEVLGKRHPNYATSLGNLALLLQDMGDHTAALPHFREALKLTGEALGKRHPHYATGLNNLALLLQAMGDHKSALPLCREALKVREVVLGKRHPDYATGLNSLALLLQDMGDHTEALPHFREALKLTGEALGKRHPHYARSLNSLAMLLHDMGDHKAALPLLREALELREEALGKRHPAYARSLNSLAVLLMATGDQKAALPLFRESLKLTGEIQGKRHPDYAASLNNLALLHQAMGDHKAALPLLREALELREEALGKRHHSYALSLNSLAVLLMATGDQKAALPLFRESLKLTGEALGKRHPHYVTSLNNLGLLLMAMGDTKAAQPLLQEALKVTGEVVGKLHPSYALSLNSLAALLQDMGDQKNALPLFREALKVNGEVLGKRHPNYATSLVNLARLHRDMGDSKAALVMSEQALGITLAHLRGNAAVQSDRQQLAAADAARSYLHTRLSIPDADTHPSAAEHVLAWKGSLMLRQQQRRLFLRLTTDPAARAEAERLQAATRRLAALRASPRATGEQLEQAEKEQGQAQARLSELSADFRKTRDAETATPEALARALPEGAALVDYHFYHQKLAAFVHRRGTPPVRVELGMAGPIGDAVGEWRRLLLAARPDRRAGEALKKLVYAPLEKHLGTAKVVLVSPDGVLGTVPFAALPGRKAGTYLIEDVAIAAVPVPSQVPDLRMAVAEKERLAPSLLAVGGVDYEGGRAARQGADARGAPLGVPRTWGALPGTAAEADAVARIFADAFKCKPVRLSRGEATSGKVRAALEKVRWAHLATHGYFAPETVKNALDGDGRGRPGERREITGWHPLLLSGLAFAGANRDPAPGEEDGILTALEVSEMDLTRLELAVLSACETGLGKVAGGEGLLGMQRAFAAAGARSVVASLWQVDDAATKQLMSDFYAQSWKEKDAVGKAEALRRAQLSLLNGKAESGTVRGIGLKPEVIKDMKAGGRVPPYYWAAFVLSGDWR